MINTKFVFGVSMVAIMAVGAAHADIAATSYFKGSAPITVDKGTISVTVDSALNSTSKNPVQNKAVNTALSGKLANTSTIKNAIVTTDANGAVAPVEIVDSGTGTYVTDVAVSAGKVTLSRGTPSINNATLTIQKNGADVGTFTANASEAKTINITVPTGSLASKSTISNTDVATNAAIAQSKIANLTTDLAAKEATANKLTSTSKIDVTDENEDILYPSVGKVQSMLDDEMGALNTNIGTANTAISTLNSRVVGLENDVDTAQSTANTAKTNAKTANDAIAAMNLTSVGADGSYIKTVSQADGKVTAAAEAADTTPKSGSNKMVTSGGVYNALADKVAIAQGTGTSNANVGKVLKVNSSGNLELAADNNTTYSAGSNVSLSGGAFSVATGSPTALGVVKVGQIPSGSATSATYASIWVE